MGIRLYLLQEPVSYFSNNTKGTLSFFTGLGILIVFGIIFSIVRAHMKPVEKKKRKYGIMSFNRLAWQCGLDRDEKKLLSYVFKLNDVDDPEFVLEKPHLLDKYFKKAYNYAVKTIADDGELSGELTKLFSLRNVLENAPIGEVITSTKQLEEDTDVIVVYGKNQYQSKVVSSRGENLTLACPKNNIGSQIRMSQGFKVSLTFLTDKPVAYETKVLETRDGGFGLGVLVPHSNKLRPLAHRKCRRKQTSIECYFSKVNVVQTGKGRKQKTKLMVEKKRFKGTILDISLGGCSIKTPVLITAGSKLKVQMPSSDDSTITCLGQVLRINRNGVGVVMHVKFLKVPKRSGNAINAMVFEFDE
jgi:c-di-GMP-binding flagellar brake protein YcgR